MGNKKDSIMQLNGYNSLKSHTAPKAEEPHRSAEELYNDRIAVGGIMHFNNHFNIIAMAEEYANQFKQSPSIKRPGIEEIEKAHSEWFEKDPDRLIITGNSAWIAGINWLLSIQSDK